MSPDELDALRERADQAFEHEGPERARELYRSLPFADTTHDDLVRLLDADAAAMLQLLRTMWRDNKGWFIGFTLADHTDKDDAIRLLGELLADTSLEPHVRWRVQMKFVRSMLDRGPLRTYMPADVTWLGTVELFLSAWRFAAGAGEHSAPLQRGMLSTIVGAQGHHGIQFLSTLSEHPDTPASIRPLVVLKLNEFELVSRLAPG
jgi:hypothetical protein